MAKPKVLFLNDTSTGHAGSVAASQSILGALRRAGADIVYRHHVGSRTLPENIWKRVQCVICHGEGTLHGTGPRAAWLLSQLRCAEKKGLRVGLVNALVDRQSGKSLAAETNLAILAVRDPISFALGKGIQSKRRFLLADSCADPRVWEGGEPLCELPPIVRGFTHPSSRCATVLDKHSHVRFGLFQPFRDVVATLRTCKVYLTGQHHGVYAAGLAGIPFVPVPSNTHKIGALIQWSGLPIPIAKTHDQVAECWKWALAHPQVFQEFHDWLISLPYLDESHLAPLLRPVS